MSSANQDREMINEYLSSRLDGNYDVENNLSNHISEYIKDERLLTLPINVLYRVLCRYSIDNQNNKKDGRLINDINDFLIKNIKLRGTVASVLFDAAKIRKNAVGNLIEKLAYECDDLDFDLNLLCKEVFQYVIKRINEIKEKEEQNELIVNEIKKKIED